MHNRYIKPENIEKHSMYKNKRVLTLVRFLMFNNSKSSFYERVTQVYCKHLKYGHITGHIKKNYSSYLPILSTMLIYCAYIEQLSSHLKYIHIKLSFTLRIASVRMTIIQPVQFPNQTTYYSTVQCQISWERSPVHANLVLQHCHTVKSKVNLSCHFSLSIKPTICQKRLDEQSSFHQNKHHVKHYFQTRLPAADNKKG